MERVYCNNLKCEYNTHTAKIPSRCSKVAITLSIYPSYIELAGRFPGTLRCTDFIPIKEQ